MRPILTDELLDYLGDEFIKIKEKNSFMSMLFETFEQYVEYWLTQDERWGEFL